MEPCVHNNFHYLRDTAKATSLEVLIFQTFVHSTLITVSSSQGIIVCKSINSQLTPSSSFAILQTSRKTWTWVPQPTRVTSEPVIYQYLLLLLVFALEKLEQEAKHIEQ